MLTRTQMENLTGVTRRMLQDYNDMGLLRFREKTPGGYWLYAEEDLDRLAVIQVLRNFGFSRSDIKEILNDPNASATELMNRAEAALLEQRRKLDQQLRTLRLIRLNSGLPPEFDRAGYKLLKGRLHKGFNLQDVLDSISPDEEDLAEPGLHNGMMVAGHIMLLSTQRDMPVESPEVQRNLAQLHSFLQQEYDMEPEEAIMLIEALAGNPDFDRQTAPGAGAFLLRCVRHYSACTAHADGTSPSAELNDPCKEAHP